MYDLPQDALDVPASPLISRQQQQQRQQDDAEMEAVQSAGGTGGEEEQDTLLAALRVQEGETVYDYAWFPRMSATDPSTCCFASTSRVSPV